MAKPSNLFSTKRTMLDASSFKFSEHSACNAPGSSESQAAIQMAAGVVLHYLHIVIYCRNKVPVEYIFIYFQGVSSFEGDIQSNISNILHRTIYIYSLVDSIVFVVEESSSRYRRDSRHARRTCSSFSSKCFPDKEDQRSNWQFSCGVVITVH